MVREFLSSSGSHAQEPMEGITVYDLLDEFITHLRVERGLAENTVQAYSRDLIRFLKYLESRKLIPTSISRSVIRDYVGTLCNSLSKRSQARNISAIKTFFRFLVSEDRMKENPARLLETPAFHVICRIS